MGHSTQRLELCRSTTMGYTARGRGCRAFLIDPACHATKSTHFKLSTTREPPCTITRIDPTIDLMLDKICYVHSFPRKMCEMGIESQCAPTNSPGLR